MKTLQMIQNAAKQSNLRLGQYFVNTYISHSWPELYYANDSDATALICQWLVDNQYTEVMPQRFIVGGV